MLDETNPMSYLPDNRNPQADYYRLENRDRQLAAIENLDDDEIAYVLNVEKAAVNKSTAKEDLRKRVQRIHEKDLIELRALVYLQSLPDTSPELIQLKAWCGCETREQIARFIADKQIKKLMMSQIEAITGGDDLRNVYRSTIRKGPEAFASLFGGPLGEGE
jgi:hypothetical protein